MIPDYQTLMLPVLQLGSEREYAITEAIQKISNDLSLTEAERTELLPSGKQTIIANRVHWAKTYLKQAGLLENPRRGIFRITENGRLLLGQNPPRIDNDVLKGFPEFNAFKNREKTSNEVTDTARPNGSMEAKVAQSPLLDDKTPDEVIRAASDEMNEALGAELLDRITSAPPEFFERLIVSLLLAMGYGGTEVNAGRAIGKSGDGGIDGVINQDALGLDRVYVQAKRYAKDNSVGAGAIRDFYGSLNIQKATKGLFVTTSSFTASAVETASKLGTRIVLMDGAQLAKAMIRYNVGCRIEDTVDLKKIDEDFFE